MGRSADLPRLGSGSARWQQGARHAAASGDGSEYSEEIDSTACPILHVDMDAFFVSVALRAYPHLRGKPVVVGGMGRRGVVSSASYEARVFGVRSAMPTARARQLCPHAAFLPVPGDDVRTASRAVMDIFRSFTPVVEQLSVDEAFLDVAGGKRLWGSPHRIGALIREQVYRQLEMTCSVGVAASKFIAKLASTRSKPDGLLVVPPAQMLEFLHPLPLPALWGVGARTQERLERMGLHTVGDVARCPAASLKNLLGQAAARHLHALAWAQDPRSVEPSSVDKSVGAEETFSYDLDDPVLLRRCLLRLADTTGQRLRRSGYAVRTVTLKVRLADFTTLNRSRTLEHPTDTSGDLYDVACRLFDTVMPTQHLAVRLLGIRGENVVAAGVAAPQLILGGREHGWRDAERAIDKVASKFGSAAVQRAALVKPHDET